MKRFDVLTIGLQVIDLMIPGMDGHILDREMTLLDHAELTLGGDALNQAIVLSQLGARTALMGAAGVDRLGDVRAAFSLPARPESGAALRGSGRSRDPRFRLCLGRRRHGAVGAGRRDREPGEDGVGAA